MNRGDEYPKFKFLKSLQKQIFILIHFNALTKTRVKAETISAYTLVFLRLLFEKNMNGISS